MDVILRKAIKDFKKLGWRSYLIILTIVFAVGGGLGMLYYSFAAIPMVNNYFDEVNHADYVYELSDGSWMNQTELDNLEDINEIDEYTGRLFWYTSMKLEGQNDIKSVILIGLDYEASERPKVYDYNIKSGENFNPNDNNLSCVIDDTFVGVNGLDIGDKIEIDGLNDAELNIVGSFNAPEFIIASSNPEFLFPVEGSNAIIFLSKETLKNYIVQYMIWYNSTTLEDLTLEILYLQSKDYNNIAATFKGDKNNGHKAMENYLRGLTLDIEKAERFEDSYGYSLMEADVNDTGEIMNILVIFATLAAVFIVNVIFNRYVYSQKQQIGILLGLGYNKKDVIRYFLFNISVISILSIPLGILMGFGFGYIMLNQLLAELTSVEIFTFPFLFFPELVYIGIFVGLSIVFLSTIFPIRNINKKIIAELIYEQTEITQKIRKPKESKVSRNITTKLVKRNVLRNKRRMTLTLLAMTLSLLIVSATQGLLDTMYISVDKTFKNPDSQIDSTENWDLNVDFQTSLNLSTPNNNVDEILDINGVKEVEVYTKGIITAVGEENQTLILQGSDLDDSNVHRFTWKGDENENKIPEKDDEIAISSVHAIKLGKELGDNLKILNAKNEEFIYTIVGIHHELVMTVYITLNAGQDLLYNGSNVVDGVYVILEDDADKQKVMDEIYEMENIEIIFDMELMVKNAMEFIDNYALVIQVTVAYTLLVSFFIVLYNAIMNIYDKNYEYGILRSLGYTKKSSFRMILIENFLQGIFPIALALIFTFPLTYELTKVYEENFPLVAQVGLPAIFMVTIPPIILYTIGSLIGLRTVYKQNLYEQVQTRFVG